MGDDLTSSRYWDSLWSREDRSTDGWLGRLRARARDEAGFAELLGGFVDRTERRPCRVLELGCAPGTILEHIDRARPGHRLHGIDFADRGVELTRRRLARRGVSAEVRTGDFRKVAADSSYDLVLSCGLIEHFSAPASILRDHVRFARPGGVVAVTVPAYASRAVRWALRRFAHGTLRTHNLDILSIRALTEAFGEAGLRDVRTGAQGPPLLPLSGVRPGVSGVLYRVAGRAWNATAWCLPGRRALWPARLWASGRVPGSS